MRPPVNGAFVGIVLGMALLAIGVLGTGLIALAEHVHPGTFPVEADDER